MPRPAPERNELPIPKTSDPSIRQWGLMLVRSLTTILMELGKRVNGSIHQDGEVGMEAPLILGRFTEETAPPAAGHPWGVIVITDSDGGEALRYSDGHDWLYLYGQGSTVPIEDGGTGGKTPEEARDDLGLGELAVLDRVNNNHWQGADLSVGNGGTGASTPAAARNNLGVGSEDSPQFKGVELGNDTDTTLERAGPGRMSVEGKVVAFRDELRPKLTADRTYYVRTDGSDSNDGLTNTAGGAFLTIQKAIDTVAQLDLQIYDAYIQVADGTYTDPIVLKTIVGAGTCYIVGNTVTPANVDLDVPEAYSIDGGYYRGKYVLNGLSIQNGTTALIYASGGGAMLEYENIVFGATGDAHVQPNAGAVINSIGSYEITSGGSRHLWVTNGGQFTGFSSSTVTLTGTPNFSVAFVQAVNSSLVIILSSIVTYSGSATGIRFRAESSIIRSFGGGLTYFPGDEEGVLIANGAYDDTTVIDASGSNANGYYQRDEHGKLEQWINGLVLTYDAGHRCSATWNFPTSFVDTNYMVTGVLRTAVNATPDNADLGHIRAVGSVGTTSVEVDIIRVSGMTAFQPGDTVSVSVRAVGRYK